MPHVHIEAGEDHGLAINAAGTSSVVLVCEHASHYIPARFDHLGLSDADRTSHAAWDPGALAVAEQMAHHLAANLIAARVSRLVYDCNRPPNAKDAVPARSEVIEVPGNRDLSQSDRAIRVNAYYRPFYDALQRVIGRIKDPIIVTIHSFTPTYFGKARSVEIGILHDSDARLADAMLQVAATHTSARVARNEPYGPEDGVTHTLKEHAIKAGHLNVMIEVRNDLIVTAEQQENMAATISNWLVNAFAQLREAEIIQCRV
jgi:predicted N-formylglutamate amidohydrolase